MNLYARLSEGLDDDERIVFPEMYYDNQKLYDQIKGVAYLVRGTGPDGKLDWVWSSGLGRLLDRQDVTVISKLFVVRLRLPWNKVEYEWLASQQELDENGQDYRIKDVFVQAVDKTDPDAEPKWMDPVLFESNRDRFEVVQVRYLVSWVGREDKTPPMVDPSRVHRVIAH